jgi:hypothetical protein
VFENGNHVQERRLGFVKAQESICLRAATLLPSKALTIRQGREAQWAAFLAMVAFALSDEI